MESKNIKTLAGFVEYCYEHPELRFWQALCNWSGYDYISAVDAGPMGSEYSRETFFWEGRRHDDAH